MKKDISKLIDNVKKILSTHKIATGTYARWIIDNGTERKMGINEYGCADAANILYTIGEFPKDVEERKEWVRIMQAMQNPETGLFVEETHHPIHTTAHCIASLELFDAIPKYQISAFDGYKTKEGLYQFLEELDWLGKPWDMSHRGAGIYAALNNAEETTAEWNEWYFQWLWNEADPETGLWRKGCVTAGVRPGYEHMAGSFHYLFNHEHAKMPLHYPDKMIDYCLEMYYKGELRGDFGHTISFLEVDWVYCITRALRQCNHRFEECVEVLTKFADEYLDYLLNLDPDTSELMDDLHNLFGSMCCVAELQRFLPGKIITKKPLKLVLDRRPFI